MDSAQTAAGPSGSSGSSGGAPPNWWLFTGTGEPMDPATRDERWSQPPPWRRFSGGPDLPVPPEDTAESVRRLGAHPSALLDPHQLSVINAAIHLRRPLLVTGSPGSGKSSLAYLIARELCLGPVLRWSVTSRTTLRGGLYDYDAIGRAQATFPYRVLAGRWPARTRAQDTSKRDRVGTTALDMPPIGEFIQLTALLPHRFPRVLLIDELDKGDFDLPNDLLNVFEDGDFTIPELVRLGATTVDVHTADPGVSATVRSGVVRCHAFPIVVITSNGEREFPPAFLRRCTVLDIPDPDVERLAALVTAHFPAGVPGQDALIERFDQRRARIGLLAGDQLLNAAHLAFVGVADTDPQGWNDLLDAVWHRLSPGAGPG